MAEPTTEERLAAVRTAMQNAIVAGGAVEWEYNGRRVRHDWKQLLEIEKFLMGQLAVTASGGRLGTLAAFESRPT